MRKLITAYTFDASAQTVTLTGLTVSIEKVLMIVNQTDGIVIYDPHDPAKGGTAATSVVTLEHDTTTMDDADKLMVFYEDDDQLGALTETAPGTDTASSGLNGRAQRIAQRLTTLITQVGTLVFGAGTAAAAQRVTLASDDPAVTLLGVKTTSVTALETGGVGIIGWLSQIWRDVKGGIVLQAGTNAIGKLAANSGVDIGDVDVTSLPKSSSANTPAIGTSATTVVASNATRKSWGIQNLGTNTLYVRMGASASTSVFHFALPPGSSSDDGFGGSVSDDTYTGDVSVAGTSPRYTHYEL